MLTGSKEKQLWLTKSSFTSFKYILSARAKSWTPSLSKIYHENAYVPNLLSGLISFPYSGFLPATCLIQSAAFYLFTSDGLCVYNDLADIGKFDKETKVQNNDSNETTTTRTSIEDNYQMYKIQFTSHCPDDILSIRRALTESRMENLNLENRIKQIQQEKIQLEEFRQMEAQNKHLGDTEMNFSWMDKMNKLKIHSTSPSCRL